MSLMIVRSPGARADVLDNAYYIAESTNLNASDRFIAATEAAYKRLAEMPGLGVPRDYNNPIYAGMRMWPVPGFRKYLIFYQPEEDYVEIIRVLHGARDLHGIFAPEDEE